MVKVTGRNLVAAMSYFLGFITGVAILLVEKDDKFVRFHAWQSTAIFGFLFITNIVTGVIFENLSFLGLVAVVVNNLIMIAALLIWVVSMIGAFCGRVFKWPIAGDFAEKQVRV